MYPFLSFTCTNILLILFNFQKLYKLYIYIFNIELTILWPRYGLWRITTILYYTPKAKGNLRWEETMKENIHTVL